jgi:starch synthase
LATAINNLLANPDKTEAMARKSRQRVEQHFSWSSIAQKTLEFYKGLLK